jgi:DNA-3-methyladenine glycosylase I
MTEHVRCPRCLKDQLYRDYHDYVWWVPVRDDTTQFAFLILEGAQAGLSRYTILKRRDGYRHAFANRNPKKVAKFTTADIERLMQDQGIIRNRAKITAAIINARIFLQIQKEFGSFTNYIRWFTDHKVIDNKLHTQKDYVATSPLSDAISADLKKRGMKFVWSTIIYAHLQATGQINDHLTSCFRYKELRGKK